MLRFFGNVTFLKLITNKGELCLKKNYKVMKIKSKGQDKLLRSPCF